MRHIAIAFFIVSSVLSQQQSKEDSVNYERERLVQESRRISTLLANQDPKMRPIGNVLYEGYHRPVVVTVNIYIRSITLVDDANMLFKVEITFRQKWKDDRLSFGEKNTLDTVTLKNQNAIWTPDTFFGTEIGADRHMIDQPNTMVRIDRDGSVFYSTRLSLTVACPMDFSDFPFDNQSCSLPIESYGYTEDDIVYVWDKEYPLQHEIKNTIPLFELTNITYDGGKARVKKYVYSFVRVVFHFQRSLGYYMYQIFIPTAMIVIASWLAFFIHPSKVTARVIYGVLLLLVLTLLSCISNINYPKTSYAKGIDYWFGVTLCLVFLALIETIIVTYFYIGKQRGLCDGLGGETEEQLITPASKWNARKRQKNIACKMHHFLSRRSEKADTLSRILFPAVFAIFVIVYFIIFAFF